MARALCPLSQLQGVHLKQNHEGLKGHRKTKISTKGDEGEVTQDNGHIFLFDIEATHSPAWFA